MKRTNSIGKSSFAFAFSLIPVALIFPAAVNAASLGPATAKAWEEYIASANSRMAQRLNPGNVFLWVDEEPERLARVRRGEIVVSPVGPQNPKRVPYGLIHDWVGATFIAGVTLSDVLHVARDYARFKDLYKPTVLESKLIATSEAADRFSMLLMNKAFFVKTALDTDYESRYVHLDDQRVYSISRATRIQEIDEYGAPAQRILDEDQGKGLIWRLFSITRYEERGGGVYLELEAIGLSRDIPGSLRWLVEPIVSRISRSTLSTSLRQTENAVRSHEELANGSTAAGGSSASTAREPAAIRYSYTAH